nr:zincin-like metallopeptidase domain-containing protein [Pseudoduganella aquatica]
MSEMSKSFVETVAERLIDQLKEGVAPWQKPWQPGEAGAAMPTNPVTGNRYKGINALHLMSQDHEDQRWMTYKQAASIGAQVRKGEKGTPIQYWKFSEEQTQTDANDKPMLDADGKAVKHTVRLERPALFMATVFNAEQIDGLPPQQPRKEQAWAASERAEGILQATGANVRHGEQDRAFYRPATDTIHLPNKGQFDSADRYYATALHELGHWTGHQSRLDRDMAHPFGSEGYAREELRAEIASMIMGDELGIGHDPKQHAAYVGSWIKAIQDDPLEIFRAAADAEKIQDYVIGLEQKQMQEQAAAQKVAEFVAANQSLLPGKVVQNTLDADPQLKAILADEVKMKALDARVNALLQGINRSYIEETKAVIASTLGRDDAGLASVTAQSVRAAYPAVPDSDLDDAQMVADFIAANMNLLPEKVAANTEAAPPALKALLADDVRMKALDKQVDQLLHNLNQAYIDETQAIIASTLGRGDAHERAERANRSRAALPAAPGREGEEAQMLADFIAANHNLFPEKVEEHAREAPPELRKLLGDEQRVQGLMPRVSGMLEGIVPAYVAQTLAAATAGVRRPSESILAEVEGVVMGEQSQMEVSMKAGTMRRTPAEEAARRPAANDSEAMQLTEGEAAVVRARLGDSGNGGALDAAAMREFGFELPLDWNGRVRVQESLEPAGMDGRSASESGAVPWSIFAARADGREQWLTDAPSQQDANRLASRLELIDAHSEENAFEKAAKLARIREEAVRLDPQSTAEDISAAREARKDAEFNATQNDADLLRRIAEQERARAALPDTVAQSPQTQAGALTYLDVAYQDKDEVKALGAKWDRREQAWYVPSGVDPAPFEKFARQGGREADGAQHIGRTPETVAQADDVVASRVYLAVPYGERIAAKAAGAEWDKTAKSWYAGPDADAEALARWKVDNHAVEQNPAMTPRDEFADALRAVGCVVAGEHPIMDGQKHRISVAGEKHSENSGAGFYVGHLDGHPAGYVKNNKTGVEMNWKSKGYALDPEQKAKLRAQAATKLQVRGEEQARQHEQAADRVSRQMADLTPIAKPTPYMQTKGLDPMPGALTDKDGKTTYIPATDADGKQWTTQYIQEDGTKRFAKDSRKAGCFHAVGGLEALAKAPALVIAEGYATASSLARSLGHATVAAFDSGNLPDVAMALHKKFPDKPVVIAGDNDQHLEATQGINPGKKKAQEAARITNGRVVLPIFAPGEVGQDPKGYTDFNDLAHKSKLGMDGVDRQVRPVVADAVEKHQAAMERLAHEQRQALGQRHAIKMG